MRTNKRVGALFRKDNQILLIHRFKNGSEYWVLPGGGVEDEETLEEALLREVKEETSLDVLSHKLLGKHRTETGAEHIFFEVIAPGDPVLGGPEKESMSEDNVYHLEWVGIDTARILENLFPAEIRQYF